MYDFDVVKTTEKCIRWIRKWFDKNGKDSKAVIGLSGGKDSTVVAALCVKALGKERVIGVAMPDGRQSINDADKIAEYLGIEFKVCPIGRITSAFSFINGVDYGCFNYSEQSAQNIPPRVRMAVLYALAQTYNGRVSCNCNFSEDYIGYATLFGDNVGSFAPIAYLTVSEVREIGHYLGLPNEWVDKIPDDGLPHSCSDEEKFGFSYETLDKYIRHIEIPEEEIKAKIDKMHEASEFKRNIIKIDSFTITSNLIFKF